MDLALRMRLPGLPGRPRFETTPAPDLKAAPLMNLGRS